MPVHVANKCDFFFQLYNFSLLNTLQERLTPIDKEYNIIISVILTHLFLMAANIVSVQILLAFYGSNLTEQCLFQYKDYNLLTLKLQMYVVAVFLCLCRQGEALL